MPTLSDERNETNEFWRAVKEERRQGNAGRVGEALAAHDEIVQWCSALGITVLVQVYGEHWRFVLPSQVIVNWWPGTDKYQVDRRDGKQARSRHVGGWPQLRDLVLRGLCYYPDPQHSWLAGEGAGR